MYIKNLISNYSYIKMFVFFGFICHDQYLTTHLVGTGIYIVQFDHQGSTLVLQAMERTSQPLRSCTGLGYMLAS